MQQDENYELDPNFAVVISFLDNFGHHVGQDFKDLSIESFKEFLESKKVKDTDIYVKLHVKLLNWIGSYTKQDVWLKGIVKFCKDFPDGDDQVMKNGYENAPIAVKLRVLKNLCEDQFEFNDKFNQRVNTDLEENVELRHEPIGKDKLGRSYWYFFDSSCCLRIYRGWRNSLTRDETWNLVCKTEEDLDQFIETLEDTGDLSQEDPVVAPAADLSPLKHIPREHLARTDDVANTLRFSDMFNSPLFHKRPKRRSKAEILKEEKKYHIEHCYVRLKRLDQKDITKHTRRKEKYKVDEDSADESEEKNQRDDQNKPHSDLNIKTEKDLENIEDSHLTKEEIDSKIKNDINIEDSNSHQDPSKSPLKHQGCDNSSTTNITTTAAKMCPKSKKHYKSNKEKEEYIPSIQAKAKNAEVKEANWKYVDESSKESVQDISASGKGTSNISTDNTHDVSDLTEALVTNSGDADSVCAISTSKNISKAGKSDNITPNLGNNSGTEDMSPATDTDKTVNNDTDGFELEKVRTEVAVNGLEEKILNNLDSSITTGESEKSITSAAKQSEGTENGMKHSQSDNKDQDEDSKAIDDALKDLIKLEEIINQRSPEIKSGKISFPENGSPKAGNNSKIKMNLKQEPEDTEVHVKSTVEKNKMAAKNVNDIPGTSDSDENIMNKTLNGSSVQEKVSESEKCSSLVTDLEEKSKTVDEWEVLNGLVVEGAEIVKSRANKGVKETNKKKISNDERLDKNRSQNNIEIKQEQIDDETTVGQSKTVLQPDICNDTVEKDVHLNVTDKESEKEIDSLKVRPIKPLGKADINKDKLKVKKLTKTLQDTSASLGSLPSIVPVKQASLESVTEASVMKNLLSKKSVITVKKVTKTKPVKHAVKSITMLVDGEQVKVELAEDNVEEQAVTTATYTKEDQHKTIKAVLGTKNNSIQSYTLIPKTCKVGTLSNDTKNLAMKAILSNTKLSKVKPTGKLMNSVSPQPIAAKPKKLIAKQNEIITYPQIVPKHNTGGKKVQPVGNPMPVKEVTNTQIKKSLLSNLSNTSTSTLPITLLKTGTEQKLTHKIIVVTKDGKHIDKATGKPFVYPPLGSPVLFIAPDGGCHKNIPLQFPILPKEPIPDMTNFQRPPLYKMGPKTKKGQKKRKKEIIEEDTDSDSSFERLINVESENEVEVSEEEDPSYDYEKISERVKSARDKTTKSGTSPGSGSPVSSAHNSEFEIESDTEVAPIVLGKNAQRVAVRSTRSLSRKSYTEVPVVIEEISSEEESEVEVVDDTPCKVCGKNDLPQTILLCDKCDDSYHTACVSPPLTLVPLGDWYCCQCEHNMLLTALKEKQQQVRRALRKNARHTDRITVKMFGINAENIVQLLQLYVTLSAQLLLNPAMDFVETVHKIKYMTSTRSTRVRKEVTYSESKFDKEVLDAVKDHENSYKKPARKYKESSSGSESDSETDEESINTKLKHAAKEVPKKKTPPSKKKSKTQSSTRRNSDRHSSNYQSEDDSETETINVTPARSSRSNRKDSGDKTKTVNENSSSKNSTSGAATKKKKHRKQKHSQKRKNTKITKDLGSSDSDMEEGGSKSKKNKPRPESKKTENESSSGSDIELGPSKPKRPKVDDGDTKSDEEEFARISSGHEDEGSDYVCSSSESDGNVSSDHGDEEDDLPKPQENPDQIYYTSSGRKTNSMSRVKQFMK